MALMGVLFVLFFILGFSPVSQLGNCQFLSYCTLPLLCEVASFRAIGSSTIVTVKEASMHCWIVVISAFDLELLQSKVANLQCL